MFALSLILPCYGRAALTRRALESIFAQVDAPPTEVFWWGDGCPVYRELAAAGWVQAAAARCPWLTLRTHCHEVRDGTPTRILNEAIRAAQGGHLLFMANDDRLLPAHLATRARWAADPAGTDLAYGDSLLESGPAQSTRHSSMEYGRIGHAEIVVRTALAQAFNPWPEGSHHRGYGHDWDFIRGLVALADPARVRHVAGPPTYVVNVGPREHVYQG